MEDVFCFSLVDYICMIHTITFCIFKLLHSHIGIGIASRNTPIAHSANLTDVMIHRYVAKVICLKILNI